MIVGLVGVIKAVFWGLILLFVVISVALSVFQCSPGSTALIIDKLEHQCSPGSTGYKQISFFGAHFGPKRQIDGLSRCHG